MQRSTQQGRANIHGHSHAEGLTAFQRRSTALLETSLGSHERNRMQPSCGGRPDTAGKFESGADLSNGNIGPCCTQSRYHANSMLESQMIELTRSNVTATVVAAIPVGRGISNDANDVRSPSGSPFC